MARRQRRHPEDFDPVANAQEEASWSGYTTWYRWPSQGKQLFRGADHMLPMPLGFKRLLVYGWLVVGGVLLISVILDHLH
jgi:hypothetical protein